MISSQLLGRSLAEASCQLAAFRHRQLMAGCECPVCQLHRPREAVQGASSVRPVYGEQFQKLAGTSRPRAVDHEWLLIG